MSDFVYALIQALHNLGAAVVVALPTAALARERAGVAPARRSAILLLVAWLLLAGSGVGFGVASLALKGALPEIEGVARWALGIKIAGAALGVATSGAAVFAGRDWTAAARRRAALVELVAVAFPLAAAAVLRWYL